MADLRTIVITRDQADAIIHKLDGGYHDREDYPPYALVSWDDRNRYRKYLINVLADMIEKP